MARQIVLFPLRWETNSSPEMGTHPQTVLDRQILAYADIVVGIFGRRIGTATPEHISGSVQEIKKHVAAGKLAMVYFSRVPVNPNLVDQDQWRALQQFKEECRTGGLYDEFETKEQFKHNFGHHLTLELNKPKYVWLPRPLSPEREETAEPALSELERQLLIAISEDANGSVFFGTTHDGFFLQTNNVDLNDGTARRTAALKHELKRLRELGYTTTVSDAKDDMTDDGFVRADEEASRHAPTAVQPLLIAKAVELLKAAISNEGNIFYGSVGGGDTIYAGGQTFIPSSDPRNDAEWREALSELETKGLIATQGKMLYAVTAAGYRVADELGGNRVQAK